MRCKYHEHRGVSWRGRQWWVRLELKVCKLRTSRYLNRARSHKGEGAVWEDHMGAEGPQVSDRTWGGES